MQDGAIAHTAKYYINFFKWCAWRQTGKSKILACDFYLLVHLNTKCIQITPTQ
jgi:hypothetical protein